jgi:hypothetical protein
MSREVLIQHYVDGSTEYGRVVQPSEMMLIQTFAHEHIEAITRDLLMRSAANPLIAGFAYSLPGNSLDVEIAAGQAVDASGHSYETLPPGDPITVTLAAAHPSLPRIDLIAAVLATDQDAADTLLPHRRLRTQLELEQGVPEYLPENFNVPTERRNTATITVHQGTPNANPVAPAGGTNEAALFQVRVDAGATTLTAGKVTDVRNLMRSLQQALALIDALNANFNEQVDNRVAALLQAVANTGIQLAYDNAANVLRIAGVAATQTVMGMLGAADKLKLDSATSAATANALSQRDVNGDVSARDYRPTRQILFPDSTKHDSATRNEQVVASLLELFSPLQMVTQDGYNLFQAAAVTNNGQTYAPVVGEVWVDAGDLANVTLCLEAKFTIAAPDQSGVTLQLYNLTDGVELTAMNRDWTQISEVARSQTFQLTGTGRKRLVLRHKRQSVGSQGTMLLWRARLIARPEFSYCGHSGVPACSL